MAFAVDPQRKAVLLVVGDKSGGSGTCFCRGMIAITDQRFDMRFDRLKPNRGR